MTTQPTEYYRPEDWPSALAALNQTDRSARPLSVPPRVPAAPYAGVEVVVDLSRLDLGALRQTDRTTELGALAPLQDLVDAPGATTPRLASWLKLLTSPPTLACVTWPRWAVFCRLARVRRKCCKRCWSWRRR